MRALQAVVTTAEEVANAAAPLAALDPSLVLVFGAMPVMEEPAFASALREAFPGADLAGCSTAGEITGDGVADGTCTITAIRFDRTAVRIAEASTTTLAESAQAGAVLGAALSAPHPAGPLAGVLLFGRGVDINGSALIDGLTDGIPARVPVSGGLAGDGGAFKRTLVLGPSGLSDRTAVAVGLYGDGLRFRHGSFGGWEPFGPARKVTRATGNILLELDGEPALNIYKRYLGDYAKDLPASGLLFPFELLNENHSAIGLIRTILGIDEAAGSLILAGTVEEGFYLRLMHASTDSLVDGAEQAAEACGQQDGGDGSAVALLVSCVGRKLVMGDRVDEEVEAVAERLPAGTVLTGFYSYGEISPMHGLADCKLHNQTMTVALLTES